MRLLDFFLILPFIFLAAATWWYLPTIKPLFTVDDRLTNQSYKIKTIRSTIDNIRSTINKLNEEFDKKKSCGLDTHEKSIVAQSIGKIGEFDSKYNLLTEKVGNVMSRFKDIETRLNKVVPPTRVEALYNQPLEPAPLEKLPPPLPPNIDYKADV